MASESTWRILQSIHWAKWIFGVFLGAVGALAASIVLLMTGAFGVSSVTVDAFGVFLMPGAVFGLVYVGVVSIDPLAKIAHRPGIGLVFGLVFGILFWGTTIIGKSPSLSGLLAALTFGVVIGVLYALSPFIGEGGIGP